MQENLSFNLEGGKTVREEGRSLLERKRYANLLDLEPKRHTERENEDFPSLRISISLSACFFAPVTFTLSRGSLSH